MRINFKHLGQAKFYLKTCKLLLLEALHIEDPHDLPTMRTFNAISRGFGYSNFNELSLLASRHREEPITLPTSEELLHAFALGFAYTLAFARERGLKCDENTKALSWSLAQKACAFIAIQKRGAAEENGTAPDPTTFVEAASFKAKIEQRSGKWHRGPVKAMGPNMAIPSGEMLTAVDAAERLGLSPHEIESRRVQNRLIALFTEGSMQWTYPAFQFDSGGVLAQVERVLDELKHEASSTILEFLGTSTDVLNGKKPIEVMHEVNRLEDILLAARCHVRRGRSKRA